MKFFSPAILRRSSAVAAVALTTTVALVAAPAHAERSTGYAFQTSGYGTRVNGGQVPTHSDTTSYEQIGCTNQAGVKRENHLLRATLPGLGTAHELTTKQSTHQKKNGDVFSRTRTHIERLVIGDGGPMGQVEIDGINTTVVASHLAKGYDTSYQSTVGSIAYTDGNGMTQEVPLPTADQPATIPGLVSISLGLNKSHTYAGSAHAAGYALRINSLATDSKAMVAHAVADVSGDVKHGLFRGQAAGIRSSALENNASVGSQPLTVIPCQGTGGKVHSKDVAGLTLDNGLVVQGLHSSQEGDQTKDAATGQAVGSVSSVDLGGGQLTIDSIKGVANVKRTDQGLTSNIKGSSIGTVTANGQDQTFPPSGVLEIPGVAKLHRNVVDRSAKGISVVALRITLLDGSGAVIDLGLAKLDIKKLR